MNAVLVVLGAAAAITVIFGSLVFARPDPVNPPARKPSSTPSDYYPDPDGSMLVLRIMGYVCGTIGVLLSLWMALAGWPGTIFLPMFGFSMFFIMMGWGLNRRTTNPYE